MNLALNADSSEQDRILDALPALVFLAREGTLLYANREAREWLGAGEGAWMPRPIEEVLWGFFSGAAEPQTQLRGTRRGSPFHATLPTGDGRLVPVEGTYSLADADARDAVIVAYPGGRERAPKTPLMENVLGSLADAVAIEHGGRLLYVNPAFARMFGYEEEDASGSLRDLIVPETRLDEHATLLRAVDERGAAMVETVRATRSGELLDVSLLIAPLLVNGVKVGYIYTFRDIGERRETEAKLQHDAMHDVLTGLPNRALLQDRMRQALSRRLRRPDQTFGVLYLDLDQFKGINDALGHAAGDELLKEVAVRLTGALRPQDSAARLGGDEFVVLVENIFAVGDLETVARRILGEIDRPFEIYGRVIRSAASMGAAMAGDRHSSPEQLMRDADVAMYRAKQAGGSRLEIFDRHLEIAVRIQNARERELRQVLEQRRFEILYQPICQLSDGRLEGFETQLAWPGAEASGKGLQVLSEAAQDAWIADTVGGEILETVCRRLREWQDAVPIPCPYVTVNLTARQFNRGDLPALVRRVLEVSGADPAGLVLEIPERVLNENSDAAVRNLQRLVDLNVRLAVDEFGSSLAPLHHLLRLPLDMVKLDPQLAPAGVWGGRQQVAVEALVRLCRSLGIHVVGDGLESEEQMVLLRRLGCAAGQGRLLCGPVEAEQVLAMLTGRSVD